MKYSKKYHNFDVNQVSYSMYMHVPYCNYIYCFFAKILKTINCKLKIMIWYCKKKKNPCLQIAFYLRRQETSKTLRLSWRYLINGMLSWYRKLASKKDLKICESECTSDIWFHYIANKCAFEIFIIFFILLFLFTIHLEYISL